MSDRSGWTKAAVQAAPRLLALTRRLRVRSIRKPNAELIEHAIEALGADRRRVFMVGDQYFTDIAGANMAGIRSVKVGTPAPASFPLAVRLLQRAETVVYRVLYRRPHAK